MTWGAVVMAGGALISGIASSKKAKQDRKNAKEDSKEMTEREAQLQAGLSQFDAEQNYYYSQLQRKNKQRGLDQFRQFSTLNQYAPNFIGGNNQIALPQKPDINKLIKDNTDESPVTPTTNKSKSGLVTALTGDPILGKLFG